MASSATSNIENEDKNQIHHIDIKPESNDDKIKDTIGFHGEGDAESNLKCKREPKRLIYCSDGVVPVYDTDDEEQEDDCDDDKKKLHHVVDPSSLSMVPWLWNRTVAASYVLLAAVDFCGEKFAYAFGITSPKYQFAIDEYNKNKAEEEEERQFEAREKAAYLAQHAAKLSLVEDGGIDANDVIIESNNKEMPIAEEKSAKF